MILLLFDPHKLDISDEFKETIRAMTGNEEKLRVCLNKADGIDQQQLLRVYGALMWSLGKVIKSPEVSRCAPVSNSQQQWCRTLQHQVECHAVNDAALVLYIMWSQGGLSEC